MRGWRWQPGKPTYGTEESRVTLFGMGLRAFSFQEMVPCIVRGAAGLCCTIHILDLDRVHVDASEPLRCHGDEKACIRACVTCTIGLVLSLFLLHVSFPYTF